MSKIQESNLDKKLWLRSYHELMQEIEDETSRADFWLDKARGLSAIQNDPTGVRSTTHYGMSDCVLKHIELASHCSELADQAKTLMDQILSAIDHLTVPEERRFLRMFYLQDYNFCQIASKMHVSLATVKRIHRRALNHLEIPKS